METEGITPGLPPPNIPAGMEGPGRYEGKDSSKKVGGVGAGQDQDTMEIASLEEAVYGSIFKFYTDLEKENMIDFSNPVNLEEMGKVEEEFTKQLGGDPISGPRGLGNPMLGVNLLSALYLIFMKLGVVINKSIEQESEFTSKSIGGFIEIAKGIRKLLEKAAQKAFQAGMLQAGSQFITAAASIGGIGAQAYAVKRAQPMAKNETVQAEGKLNQLQNEKMVANYQERQTLKTEMKALGGEKANPTQYAEKKTRYDQLKVIEKSDYQQRAKAWTESHPKGPNYTKTQYKEDIQNLAKQGGYPGDVKGYAEKIQKDHPDINTEVKLAQANVNMLNKTNTLRAYQAGFQASQPASTAFQAGGQITSGGLQAGGASLQKESDIKRAESEETKAGQQIIQTAVEKGGQAWQKEVDNYKSLVDAMNQISQTLKRLGISIRS